MKISFIVSDFKPISSGIGNATYDLSEALIKKGFDVNIITPRRIKESKKIEVIDGMDIIRPKYIPKSGNKYFNLFRTFIFILVSIFYSYKCDPDIILSQEPDKTGPMAIIIGKLFNKKIISYTHADPHFLDSLFLTKFTYKYSNILWTTNNDFKKIISKLSPNKKIIVIPNIKQRESDLLSIDKSILRKKFNMDGRKKHFLCIGRLVSFNGVEIKGISYVISAFKELGDNYILHIFGEGPLLKNLQNLARGHKNIIFYGNVDKQILMEYIYASDCFILSSLTEGLSMSFLEATSVHTPLITTKTSGVIDYIRDGYNGIYIKKKDMYSIISAVKRMLMPKTYSRIKKNTKSLYESNFTPEVVVNKAIEGLNV